MTVMRFVVDDHDAAVGIGFAVRNARYDFSRGFLPASDLCGGRRLGAAVQQVIGVSARFVGDALSVQLLFVDDAYLGQVQSLFPFPARRQDAKLGIVVLRTVGNQAGFQPFLDGQARRQQQEAADEACVVGVGLAVGDLPSDEHRHGQGFAGAGGHLVGNARDAVVLFGVDGCQFLCNVVRGDFVQVDVRQHGIKLGEVKAAALPVRFGASGPVPD